VTEGLEEAARILRDLATVCEGADAAAEPPQKTLREAASLILKRADHEDTDPLNMTTCIHCGATSVIRYTPPRG